MKSINEKIAAAEATVTNLKRIKVTCKKVEALLKKEGYSSLEQFMAKIHAPAVEEKSAAIAPRAGRKGKRPRMTAAKVAKMKVLRATMSRKKVADRIGCSEQTVVNWENKKFVFTKR
jgi:DNA-binding transcriptional regulator YiaG